MPISSAYRFFGKFLVQHENGADEKTSTTLSGGALDVYLAPYGSQNKQDIGVFLRWRRIPPGAKSLFAAPPENPPDVRQNVYLPNEFNLAEALAQADAPAGPGEVSFWISKPKAFAELDTVKGPAKKQVIQFENIACFEVCNLKTGAAQQRYPCIFQISTSDETARSFLRIAHGSHGYEFVLAAMLPAPQPIGNGKVFGAREAVGFSMVFATAFKPGAGMDKTHEIFKPISFRSGLPGWDRWHSHNNPFSLGGFGFSAKPADVGGKVFLNYRNGMGKMRGPHGVLAAEFLERLGFPNAARTSRWQSAHNIEFRSESAETNEADDNPGAARLFTYKMVCRRTVKLDHLDLSEQLGGIVAPLRHNKTPAAPLLTEAELSIPLSDADVLAALHAASGQEPELTARLESRLSWREKIFKSPEYKKPDKDQQSGQMALHGAGLLEAIRLMARARAGLLATRSQPQSFLPQFDYESTKTRFMGFAGPFTSNWRLGREMTWGNLRTGRNPVRLGLSLAPKADAAWAKGPGAGQIKVKASFPGFSIPKAAHDLVLVHDARAANPADQEDSAFFRIAEVKSTTDPGRFRGRLGALFLTGVPKTVPSTKNAPDEGLLAGDVSESVDSPQKLVSRITLGRRARAKLGTAGEPLGEPSMQVGLDLLINLGSARPQTVDRPHGDRRERPDTLLIDENALATGGADGSRDAVRRFVLRVAERVRDDQDSHLTAALLEANAEPGEKKAAVDGAGGTTPKSGQEAFSVISQAPFSVYRFTRLPLERSGNDEKAIVAEWDSDQRTWRYKKVSELYRFTFPPAVTTDAADKPFRLELHDADETHTGSPVANGVTDPVDAGRFDQLFITDARMSPATDVWIRPGDLNRDYELPEYSGRAIFGGQGDFGPGVQLAGLRGELLYPLAFGLAVPPPESAALPPRIAELAALAGNMARVEITNPDGDTARRWNALRRALDNRVERLEAWSLDPRRADPFVPAKFRKGLEMSLRRTGLLKPPVKDFDAVQDDGPSVGSATVAPPRLSEFGLAGGALWPFESLNYVKLLLDNPVADGGSLEGFSITPLGGSGNQGAEFLGGNVRIMSETRNGFVQKMRIEVKGRIATFWHRARHVIVYERTTAASDQFTPQKGARTRSARPILRKVDEFIELLEPIRRYPDFADHSTMGSGALEEVRFNSRIIRVDSAWGGDVANIGWMVPLWNPGAARERPQVYPFPDIAFATRGEGSENRPLVVQECLDADNIYFWADAKSAGERISDTDLWPSRRAIDYGALCAVQKMANLHDLETWKENAPRRPAAARILPGMRRFTWRLAAAATRSQINAGYGDKPVFGGFESVTFMRSQPPTKLTSKLETAIKARIAISENESVSAVEKVPAWRLGAKKNGLPALEEIENSVQKIREMTTPAKKDAATLAGNIEAFAGQNNPADVLRSEVIRRLGAAGFVGAVQDFLDELKDTGNQLDGFDARTCDRLARQVSDEIAAKKLLITEQIKQAQRQAIDQLDDIQLVDFETLVAVIVDILAERTDLVIARGQRDVGNLISGVEKARMIVRDWREDAQKALQQARGRVDAWNAAYDRDKPWSPSRIMRAEAALRAELDAISEEAQGALDEARLRMSGEIDATAVRLTTQVSMALAHGLSGLGETARNLQSLRGQLDRFSEQARAARKMLAPNGSYATGIQKTLDDLQSKISGMSGESQETARRLHETLSDTFADAKKLDDEIRDRLAVSTDGVSEALGKIQRKKLAALKDVERLEAAAKAAIEDIHAALQVVTADLGQDLSQRIAEIEKGLSGLARDMFTVLRGLSLPGLLDQMVRDTRVWIDDSIDQIGVIADTALGTAQDWLAGFEDQLKRGSEKLAATLAIQIRNKVLEPAVRQTLAGLSGLDWQNNAEDVRNEARRLLNNTADQVYAVLDDGALGAQDFLADVKAICDRLAGFSNVLWTASGDIGKRFEDLFNRELKGPMKTVQAVAAGYVQGEKTAEELLKAIRDFERPLTDLVNQVAQGAEIARAYVDRIVDHAANIGQGGLDSVPNNALKLYSAATQSPEIAALRANMDRIRVSYNEVAKAIDSSRARALFDKLGDGLKAMGIDLPFNAIGDVFTLDADALQGQRLDRILGQFGGIDLAQLAPDFGAAGGLGDAIRVSHDFDKKTAQAWVQVDVNVPMRGRRALFSLGPFTLFFRDSVLGGFVRLSASKDTEDVAATDHAQIRTNIEAVVGGQIMVTLRDVVLTYTSDGGLDVDFDARKIDLNPTFRFVTDVLGGIFRDDFGGMNVIKEKGIPVGLEYLFALPPMSLMYGASGVSNLAISNRLSILAFPDFVIANSFNLSRRELPFLFSIFIIGGTGYIQIDSEYRPFDKSLMVVVEAAAGGSAALGFALGPVAGGVFISISVAIRYQKRVSGGKSEGSGLTVSLVLIVAGNVSLWGIVTIYLGLELTISYHESGRMDGLGSLSVEVRISRWFKLKYSTQVTYKLRDGKTTRLVQSKTELGGEYYEKAKKQAASLKKARKAFYA